MSRGRLYQATLRPASPCPARIIGSSIYRNATTGSATIMPAHAIHCAARGRRFRHTIENQECSAHGFSCTFDRFERSL